MLKLLPLGALLLAAGCATLPSGPSVMSLPGSRKNFDEFRADDAVCRQFAFEQVGGTTAEQSAAASGAASAAIGTAIGAGAGALMAGSSGAGVGAGIGLITGALVGTSYAGGAYWSVQQRYDNAYQQCMYAKGNKIPVSVGYARAIRDQSAAAPAPVQGAPYPYPPPPNAPAPNIPPPNAPPPPR